MIGLLGPAAPALADSGHWNHDHGRSDGGYSRSGNGDGNNGDNNNGDGNNRDGNGGDSNNGDSGHHHRRHHQDNGTLFVAPNGSSSGSGWSCDDATFSSINAAVAAAAAGGTVVVCPGTYSEDVIVNKALNLMGRDATIDATGLENGVQVVASNVVVDGFTIQNANGEGVLAGVDALTEGPLLPATGPVLTDVTVSNNAVINNDKGFHTTSARAGSCCLRTLRTR